MNAALPKPRVVEHDAAPGPLTRCQVTGSENLHLVLDLGNQAPCDALVADPQAPEETYPLRLMFCPDSGLAQIDFVVPGDVIYPAEYPYRAGISWPLRQYQRAFAAGVMERFRPEGPAFVVDVGCNDGLLLTGFRARGCKILGVEPTNMARIARTENNVPVRQAFFTEALAREIVADEGRADFVTMTNVFAHMADLGEVMRGLDALLADRGVFITESHYLLDVLERTQFDTIYHEHIRTYSLKALVLLFRQYGMEVFHVERGTRYGGNIRAYVGRAGRYPTTAAVGELLGLEERSGLHTLEAWAGFRARALRERGRMMEWLYREQRLGRRTVGVSCPGRSVPLMNWYGIGPELVEYLGEIPGSLKIGKYTPGRHIPIVDNRRIPQDQPDNAILFAWHYAAEIIERLKKEGVRARLALPLPGFTVAGD